MPSADDPRYLDWMTSAAWNGPVSAPVVDGDLLLVAVPWRHRIEARSSADGTLRWTWQGDGRIDSPPTIYGDLILVGGRDGTVTCLDRASGRTRWRFLAARHHRRLPAYGQVESAWPVAGSVLIHEGLAIVAAGYHPETDGGITVWGLDPVSGTVRWKQQIARDQTTPIPWPRPDGKPAHPAPHPLLRRIPSAEWSNMVRADLLAASGRCVVMPGAILQAADGAFVSGFALNPGGVALGEELPAKAPIDHLLVGNVQALLLNDRLEDFSGPGNKSPLVVARKGKVAWGQRVAADGDLVYRSLEPERRNLTIDCLSFADPANGKQGIKPRWSTIWPHKAERIAALALSTDRVVVASEPERGPLAGRRGRLALLDRASGAIVQQLDLPAAPCTHGLAIAGGAVYVTRVDGTLLRLAGAAPGPARQATVPASKS
jgi:outer membrane protein assembly factor BamB